MGGQSGKEKRPERKKFLCPTRLLFCSDRYAFLWNDECCYASSDFEIPSPANYVRYVECVDEYPSEYILTWKLPRQPFEERYARLTLSNEEKPTIDTLQKHPYPLGKRRKRTIDRFKNIFSPDKRMEVVQESPFAVGTAVLIDHKTGKRTKLENTLGVCGLYGDSSSDVVVVMIACEVVRAADGRREKCYTARKITDSGLLLPPHSTLKTDAYNSFISSFLYDGRFVVVGRGRQQKNRHTLRISFWFPWSPSEVAPRSFLQEGPFGEATYCWQLPSTQADVDECRQVLGQWTNLPRDVIELIVGYVCLSTSSLASGPQAEFCHDIVTKL